MSTTATYEVTDSPKSATMQSFDCAECGHEELARPVFLRTSSGNTIAVGTGCAAKLTGRPAAEFEADLALARLAELTEARPHLVPDVWTWFRICRPGRVTPKFLSETTDRYRDADLVAEIAGIWKAAGKVGRA